MSRNLYDGPDCYKCQYLVHYNGPDCVRVSMFGNLSLVTEVVREKSGSGPQQQQQLSDLHSNCLRV